MLARNEADVFLLVSGDTDYIPAVKTARQLYGTKKFGFAFPYDRKYDYLEKLSDVSFQFDSSQYVNHQFPDPYVCADGTEIKKPATW